MGYYYWDSDMEEDPNINDFVWYEADVAEDISLMHMYWAFLQNQETLVKSDPVDLMSQPFDYNGDYLTWRPGPMHVIQSFGEPLFDLVNKLPSLTELNLKHNKFDQRICPRLRQNTTLETLNLFDCMIGDDAAVCEALHDHPSLTWLDLGAGSPNVASERSISAAGLLLQTKIPLTSLFFDARLYNSVAIVDLVEGLKVNQTLTFLSLY
eukprot:TRINITY_DN2319_c0_g1_i1.p1 TRINITY_DN2319_c0_g1~~TRINITY_DN2319_c0_g1_i1.p1  ORF type:complete len:209 (+),score=30.27 TRINITY_DN2319_c0_g1_i1:219-845(+)